MDIVERIKSLCAERGITLNQMEKELGLKGTVARWADHEPSVGKVLILLPLPSKRKPPSLTAERFSL